jgi:hypothetical protein
LWSLHPSHLDSKGLVALWREGLLARAVLRGQTRGYRHHPQLERFRSCAQPIAAIDAYLQEVAREAARRGYDFDRTKLGPPRPVRRVRVRAGQLAYEWEHLLRKLYRRDRRRWLHVKADQPTCHPSFRVVAGGLEPWERPPKASARRRAS